MKTTGENTSARPERSTTETLTRAQIAQILGDISDDKAVAIIRTRATERDLEEVVVWTACEDDVMGELERPLVGIPAQVYEILTADETFDDAR